MSDRHQEFRKERELDAECERVVFDGDPYRSEGSKRCRVFATPSSSSMATSEVGA